MIRSTRYGILHTSHFVHRSPAGTNPGTGQAFRSRPAAVAGPAWQLGSPRVPALPRPTLVLTYGRYLSFWHLVYHVYTVYPKSGARSVTGTITGTVTGTVLVLPRLPDPVVYSCSSTSYFVSYGDSGGRGRLSLLRLRRLPRASTPSCSVPKCSSSPYSILKPSNPHIPSWTSSSL